MAEYSLFCKQIIKKVKELRLQEVKMLLACRGFCLSASRTLLYCSAMKKKKIYTSGQAHENLRINNSFGLITQLRKHLIH